MLFPYRMIFYSKCHLSHWIIVVIQKINQDFYLLLFDKNNQLVTIISSRGNPQGCCGNVKQILIEWKLIALENLDDSMEFFELTHPGIATWVENIRESLPEYTWCVDISDSPNHVWPDYIHPTLICVYTWRLMNLDYCPHHEFFDFNPGLLPRLVLEKYF